MDYRLLMDTSILAGEIIMENGGEAYRAEETVNRMLNTSNAKHVEVVVMGTSMVATVSNPYRDAITATRRIRRRGTNLQRIAQVNDISREMCDGKLSLEEAFHQLKQLREKTQYPEWIRIIASMIGVMGFTYTFGGRGMDLLFAMLCGAAVYAVQYINRYTGLSGIINVAMASFAVSVVAVLLYHLFPEQMNPDTVIIGGLMLLVPGLAITNSARDLLAGDYVSGTARVMEAVVTSLAIVLGTGLALILRNLF